MDIRAKISELGWELPPAPPPAGVYKPVLEVGNMLYVSGQGPVLPDGSLITGRVGDDLDKDQGKEAAKQVGLTMLSTILTHYPHPEKIIRIVKTLGMVNVTADFGAHPYVINGFSELMATLFGADLGIGARSAVGMHLPGNIAVEIEAQFLLG